MRSSETFLRIEHLIRSGRSQRLSPRFFSLPGDFLGIPRTRHPEDRVGNYRIEEVLKIEGLSQVYRATDTRTGTSYALKMLPMELSRDPLLLMRFEEEALALKRIEHPRVIKIRDMGEDFGDRFLVLDLAKGGRIGSQECRDLSEPAKPFREEVIIDLTKQICDALRHVHTLGIVHRDLKPGNLLLSGNQVLLTDFGIAHSRGKDGATLTGMPVGTPNYMAPEQILGETVDHRTDLYSLGCVLYEFATGRPPYEAEMPLTTTLYHLQAAPADIRDLNPRISPGLANIILKLLQKDPAQRYQSAQELFRDLSRVHKNPAGPQVFQAEKMPGATRAEIQKKLKRQYRFRLLVIAAAAAISLAGLGLYLLGRDVWEEYQVAKSVKEAESAWKDQRWPEALEALQLAHRKDREHPDVQRLISQIASQGALTIRTQPPDLEMELFPDDETARQVDLQAPKLLGEGPRFRSGTRIKLETGHWRVNISRPGGGPWAQALVYVGQVRRRQDTGWKSEEHLRHQETRDFRPAQQQDSSSFVLGEEVVIDPLVLPDPQWLAEGMIFVNEGPFWRSRAPSTIVPRDEEYTDHEDQKRHVKIYDASILEHDYLPQGFLISPNEITVGEFKKWYERLGPQVIAWLSDVHSNFSRRKRSTHFVDLQYQKDCWKEELKARGIDADSVGTPEKLLDLVLEEDLKTWTRVWSVKYEPTLIKFLAEQKDDALPIVTIGWVLVGAYVRTHAEIRPEEFRSWLKWKIEDARAASLALQGVQASVSSGSPGDWVDPAQLPGKPLINCIWLRDPKPEREPLLDAYARWLSEGAFYGCQLPLERILAWAQDSPKVRETFEPGDLDRIRKDLRCSAWIGSRPKAGAINDAKPQTLEQKLIDLYAQAIREKKEQPLKEHLRRWIGERIQEENDAIKSWEEMLGRMSVPSPDAVLKGLPFEIRYQFGADMGWDLASTLQWEKAFRGGDARAYPWGDRQDDVAAWLNRGVNPNALPIITARMRDRSPYGVWCMAGNVSEWVHGPGPEQSSRHFLKGGNFKLDSLYSNAGYFLGMEGGTNTVWAGIRVVRNIRPLPAPGK
jgi:hypothetical protein